MNTAPVSTKKPVASPAQEEEEDNEIKCFIGNLPFGVKEEEIKEFFASCGTVYICLPHTQFNYIFRTGCQIISRYGRSLGFGFVSFDTLAEAEKATSLDKTELLGRAVNIEVARKKIPASERVPREPRAPRQKKDVKVCTHARMFNPHYFSQSTSWLKRSLASPSSMQPPHQKPRKHARPSVSTLASSLPPRSLYPTSRTR
jgi:RNA recognition motif-containing protein